MDRQLFLNELGTNFVRIFFIDVIFNRYRAKFGKVLWRDLHKIGYCGLAKSMDESDRNN